jgi:hypothetical protein
LRLRQEIRLHRARALVDGGGRFRHFQRQFFDFPGIIDQLGERLPVFPQRTFIHFALTLRTGLRPGPPDACFSERKRGVACDF